MRAAAWLLALLAPPAFAQSLQPGFWQFDTSMLMRGTNQVQTNSVQRCVKPDEAADVQRWAGRSLAQTDCRMAIESKTRTSSSWILSCPKTGLTGTGSAQVGRGSMSTFQHMTGKVEGVTYEMEIRTTGKRLGPCK